MGDGTGRENVPDDIYACCIRGLKELVNITGLCELLTRET